MRISQFSVKIKVKVWTIFDLFVAKTNGLALLDEDAAEERIEDGLHVLLEVLNEQNLTSRYAPEKGIKFSAQVYFSGPEIYFTKFG